jgi:hypothetical protein
VVGAGAGESEAVGGNFAGGVFIEAETMEFDVALPLGRQSEV